MAGFAKPRMTGGRLIVTVAGHRSVHQERIEGLTFGDGLLDEAALFVEFPAQCGAAAVLLAGKFTLHPAFKGNEKPAPAVGIEVDAAVSRFDVSGGIEGTVAEGVEHHSVNACWPSAWESLYSINNSW
jgi:hypothetical protein